MKKAKRKFGRSVISSMGEGDLNASLFSSPAVERGSGRQVSQSWLSACTAQRTLTIGLLDKAMEPVNLLRSYRRVMSNKGSAGVDGMEVKDLKGWISKNFDGLRAKILECSYRPQAVRGVEIPKPNGGKRQLGIPTVIDRMVQQAIYQVLSPEYDDSFSEHSYGFRPKRNAHQGLNTAARYVESGKNWVVDLDLEKFFDEVNHDRLMWLLSTRIGDKRILKLIRKYLQSGMMQGGLTNQRIKGTPQGSPLSPLLSNIVLDELDKELERRGLSYVRYADDIKIFCGSSIAAQRAKENITGYITQRLKLKVNGQKSRICRGYELNFLGHSILSGGRIGLSNQSEKRLKEKVKQITRRNRGVNMGQMLKELHTVLQGWLNYFRHASMRRKLAELDGWIRRRLRCVRIKQCKRTIGIVRWLRKLGMQEKRCWLVALSGKGWWRLSNNPAVNEAMNNDWFAEQGYYSLLTHYDRYKLSKTAVCV